MSLKPLSPDQVADTEGQGAAASSSKVPGAVQGIEYSIRYPQSVPAEKTPAEVRELMAKLLADLGGV